MGATLNLEQSINVILADTSVEPETLRSSFDESRLVRQVERNLTTLIEHWDAFTVRFLREPGHSLEDVQGLAKKAKHYHHLFSAGVHILNCTPNTMKAESERAIGVLLAHYRACTGPLRAIMGHPLLDRAALSSPFTPPEDEAVRLDTYFDCDHHVRRADSDESYDILDSSGSSRIH